MDPEPSSGLLLRRVLATLVGVAVALGGGFAALRILAERRAPPARKARGVPPPVVRTERLDLHDHRVLLEAYGEGRALRQARVAAEVSGLVEAVSAELRVGAPVAPPPRGANGGDAGAAGEPLVRLARADLEDAVARTRAEQAEAHAQGRRLERQVTNLRDQQRVGQERLETAQAELSRITALVPATLAPSEADRQRLEVLAIRSLVTELRGRLDDAEGERDVLAARLDVLAAAERQGLRDLERTRVHAPFAGTVTARHVEPGTRVSPGAPLFDLVDDTLVEVALALPASRHGDVAAGSRVALRLREDGEVVWRGAVARRSPTVEPGSRTFLVFAEVERDGAPAPVPPGAHVVAEIEGPLVPGVLAVPRDAFVGDRVYVAGDAGADGRVARERRPQVHRVLPAVVLVRPGEGPMDLRPGDEVVVTNLEDVADGARVRVAPQPSPAR